MPSPSTVCTRWCMPPAPTCRWSISACHAAAVPRAARVRRRSRCFNLVHPALPHLCASAGNIVAVTTAATDRFPVRDGLSSAPKGAVEALSRALAAEEGRFGVRVNCVGPGMLTDGMAERLMSSGDLDERALEVARNNIPLRRSVVPATSPPPCASSPATKRASSPGRSSTSTAATASDAGTAARTAGGRVAVAQAACRLRPQMAASNLDSATGSICAMLGPGEHSARRCPGRGVSMARTVVRGISRPQLIRRGHRGVFAAPGGRTSRQGVPTGLQRASRERRGDAQSRTNRAAGSRRGALGSPVVGRGEIWSVGNSRREGSPCPCCQPRCSECRDAASSRRTGARGRCGSSAPASYVRRFRRGSKHRVRGELR